MADLIKIRRDTKAHWDAVSGDVILQEGEIGIITDVTPKQCKIGNGYDVWGALPYQSWVDPDKLEGYDRKDLGYVVCSTEGGQAAKVVNDPATLINYELSKGVRLLVKVNQANTASGSITLAVNGTDAKPLRYNGAAASDTNTWANNEVLDVYYDGTNYIANTHGGAQFATGQKVGDVEVVNIPGNNSNFVISQKGATDLVSEYNVSANNNNAEYTFAQAVALVPASLQKGGLTIKYSDSTTHKYVIKRLMSSTWSIVESEWQGIDDEPKKISKNLVESAGVYPTKEAVDNTTYKHNNLVDLNDIVSGEWISPTYGTIIQDNNSYHTNKIPVKAGQVLWFTGGTRLVCYNNGVQYKGSPSSESAPPTLNPWTVPDGVTEIVVNGSYNSQHIINKIYISVGGEKAVQEEYGYFTKTSDGIVENGELPVKAGDVYADGGGTFNSGEKVRNLTIESSVSQTNNTNKIPNSNAVNTGLNNIAPYFICETAGDVAEKVVDAPGFVLRKGGSIKIKMNNAHIGSSATLNINNTGAKGLYYRGMRVTNGYSWLANEVIDIYYNGSAYYARPFTGGFETIEDFNISVYNAVGGVPAKYATLNDALAAVPNMYRNGGMSIKYLPTEGDYYVRYRLDYKNWSDNPNSWYGIEDIPTENSRGVITSGGVANALKPINAIIESSIIGFSKTVTKTFTNGNPQPYITDLKIPANTPFKVKVSSNDAVWTQLYVYGNSPAVYGEWDIAVDNGVEKEVIVPVEVTTIRVFPRYYTSLGDITLEVTCDSIAKTTNELQEQIDAINISSIQSQIDTLNTKVDAEVENPELLLSENDSEGRALRTISKDSETHYMPQNFEESITLSKKAYEGLIQSMRSYEIPEVMEIELGEPEVALSTQDADVSTYDDLQFGYSKVLKISENMYYMYYHAWGSGTTVPYAIDNTKLPYTTLFAHSTDGINWTRGFPEGVTPPYTDYPHSVKFLNERGTPTYEPATNVFMVHDSEYPFRCITSEGSSKIYKSRDGFTFEQPKLIEYDQVRDTQPGVVLRGDVCKIYGRGWTGGYPTTHPESGYGSRNIIVFYADYNGNLMCQETPVVEGKYYNSAAFAIDDHREMIIPTFYSGEDIPVRFDAYIIDGRHITQVNIDSDKMLANGTYKWGLVAPCIIATGGKTYIYYNVLTVSHNQIVTQASRVCNIMRVEIKFKSNSLKYKI